MEICCKSPKKAYSVIRHVKVLWCLWHLTSYPFMPTWRSLSVEPATHGLSWPYMDSVSVACGRCGLHIWAFPFEFLLDMGIKGILLVWHRWSQHVMSEWKTHSVPLTLQWRQSMMSEWQTHRTTVSGVIDRERDTYCIYIRTSCDRSHTNLRPRNYYY